MRAQAGLPQESRVSIYLPNIRQIIFQSPGFLSIPSLSFYSVIWFIFIHSSGIGLMPLPHLNVQNKMRRKNKTKNLKESNTHGYPGNDQKVLFQPFFSGLNTSLLIDHATQVTNLNHNKKTCKNKNKIETKEKIVGTLKMDNNGLNLVDVIGLYNKTLELLCTTPRCTMISNGISVSSEMHKEGLCRGVRISQVVCLCFF